MKSKLCFLLILLSPYFIELRSAPIVFKDTLKILHTLDGNLSEWPSNKFEKDKETEINYAVDWDENNLFLAISVHNKSIQRKMMMMGLELYLDKKGKHREGMGIEFPIKRNRESAGDNYNGERNNRTSGEAPDLKAMQEKLAAGMIFLKTFGFIDQEDKTQLIAQQNGVNVSFDWDTNNTLIIEYQIPISFIGKAAELKGKPLSIGWNIKGVEQNLNASAGRTEIGSGNGNSRGSGALSPGRSSTGATRDFGAANSPSGGGGDDMFKDQRFWTKIIFNY